MGVRPKPLMYIDFQIVRPGMSGSEFPGGKLIITYRDDEEIKSRVVTFVGFLECIKHFLNIQLGNISVEFIDKQDSNEGKTAAQIMQDRMEKIQYTEENEIVRNKSITPMFTPKTTGYRKK